MSTDIQHADAVKLVQAMKYQAAAGLMKPLLGYHVAGELICRSIESNRHMGQVCSRIDIACFYAGLPMLAMYYVLHPSGCIYDKAFTGPWVPYRDEALEIAATHEWQQEDFDLLTKALHDLPNKTALTLWKNVENREACKPGFIRYNLHRRTFDRHQPA